MNTILGLDPGEFKRVIRVDQLRTQEAGWRHWLGFVDLGAAGGVSPIALAG